MRSNQTFFTTLAVLLAVVGSLSITACNKNSGDAAASGTGGNPQIANVPSPTVNSCFQNATASSWWQRYNVQPYPMAGYGPQNYAGAFSQGFCGCPTGTMPTCSTQGLLCMPVQHMNMNVATWTWNGQNGVANYGQFDPQYRCENPYSAYGRYHRQRWGNGECGDQCDHRRDDQCGDQCDNSRDDHRDDGPVLPPGEHGERGFFYQYGYSYWYGNQPQYPQQYPQQPIPQNPQTQTYPNRGTCTGAVAQLCTPNASIPLTPGQMYCQPLQPGNFSGPGIWVRL